MSTADDNNYEVHELIPGTIFTPLPSPNAEELLALPNGTHFVTGTWDPGEEPNVEFAGSVMSPEMRRELMREAGTGARYSMTAIAVHPLTREKATELAGDIIKREFDGVPGGLERALDTGNVSAADVIEWMAMAAQRGRVDGGAR